MSSGGQRPFLAPRRPWRKPAPEWIRVEGNSFALPAQCALLGCLSPAAPGQAFCGVRHYREACKLSAHGADGGRCGWLWSETA